MSNRLGAVLSVGPIRIVASVHRPRGKSRIGAHLPTERMDGGECRFSGTSGTTYDIANVEHPFAELNTDRAAADVCPETDALRIDLPEAERPRAGAHAVRVRERSIIRGDIPRHDAVRDPSAPFEISITSLPRVADDEARVAHSASPAEMQSFDGDARRVELDAKGGRLLGGRDRDSVAGPTAVGRVNQMNVTGRGLHQHSVRRAASRVRHSIESS